MIFKIGDKAPDFTLMTDKNTLFTLHELQGKKVVLYFYPKDDTPGCTKQACDFRDTVARLMDKNTVVVGISKDSAAKHTKFKQKYALSFPLLADENGDVCEKYGVMNKKSLFGKTFLGIQRSTFLIDEQGIFRAIWRKVKVNGHIQQVLDELNKK